MPKKKTIGRGQRFKISLLTAKIKEEVGQGTTAGDVWFLRTLKGQLLSDDAATEPWGDQGDPVRLRGITDQAQLMVRIAADGSSGKTKATLSVTKIH